MGGGEREREVEGGGIEINFGGCSFIHARTHARSLAWWWTFTKVSRTFMGADVGERERERWCRVKRYEMRAGIRYFPGDKRVFLPRRAVPPLCPDIV